MFSHSEEALNLEYRYLTVTDQANTLSVSLVLRMSWNFQVSRLRNVKISFPSLKYLSYRAEVDIKL